MLLPKGTLQLILGSNFGDEPAYSTRLYQLRKQNFGYRILLQLNIFYNYKSCSLSSVGTYSTVPLEFSAVSVVIISFLFEWLHSSSAVECVLQECWLFANVVNIHLVFIGANRVCTRELPNFLFFFVYTKLVLRMCIYIYVYLVLFYKYLRHIVKYYDYYPFHGVLQNFQIKHQRRLHRSKCQNLMVRLCFISYTYAEAIKVIHKRLFLFDGS